MGVAALGCSTGYNRGALDAELRDAKATYVTSDLTVEQIEAMNPQLALPARIAVAPPTAFGGRWRNATLDTWSPAEVAVIESWLAPLRDAGVARELLVLPSGLVAACDESRERGCRLRAQHAAAARVHADALLVVSLATATDEYANPSSILYVTIVGMWIVPGTHRDALTVAEGVLLDNRNEYLYAFARGEGETKIVRPVVYADSAAAVASSRLTALERFGRAFIEQARQLRAPAP